MPRWGISPLIGDGTITIVPGQESTTGPYRAKAASYGGHVAVIPGESDGTPLFNWALIRIADDAVAAAEADADLTVFPDLALDDVLTAGQRNWLITRLQHHNLGYAWVTAGITVREALRTIGRYLDSQFDISWANIA